MTNQISAWKTEHDNFRRLLDLLESQIGLFHEAAQPNYELMLDIIYYLRHYPDRVHHPREDAAIARLVDRDSSARDMARRLLGEHEVLAKSGTQLLEQLDCIVSDALVSREALEASAATYITYYRQHMSREEADLFPRAEKLLRRNDWAAVDSAIATSMDPLFGKQVEQRYQALNRRIALEAGCASD